MLRKVIPDWHMYHVIDTYSASVGHVIKTIRVNSPDKPFIIKVPKPKSIAQSCWEYSILHDIFPKESCEYKFIINILKSNG